MLNCCFVITDSYGSRLLRVFSQQYVASCDDSLDDALQAYRSHKLKLILSWSTLEAFVFGFSLEPYLEYR